MKNSNIIDINDSVGYFGTWLVPGTKAKGGSNGQGGHGGSGGGRGGTGSSGGGNGTRGK